MAKFHFRVDDIFFYLDATTNVDTTNTARLSSSPMQNGVNQSDHYIVDQQVCSMSGLITDIKTAKSADIKPTGKWIDEVLRLAVNGRSPVLLRNRIDAEETGNWFITSFKVSQDNSRYMVGHQGSGGEVKQAFRVSIQLKQALLAQGLTSTIQPPQQYIDALQVKGKKNSTTQQFDESTKGQTDREYALEQARINFEAAGIGGD